MIVTTDDPIREGDWFINEADRKPIPYKAEKNRFGHLGYNPRDYTPRAWFNWMPLGDRHKRLAVSPVLIRQVLDSLGLLEMEKEVMAGYLDNLQAPVPMGFARFAESIYFLRKSREPIADDFVQEFATVKACTCRQCRAGKSRKRTALRRRMKRLTSKQRRRAGKATVKNFYWR